MEWVNLTTAPDQVLAEMWVELLRTSGIDARLSPADEISFLGLSNKPCRVMVLESDLEKARTMLASLEGSDDFSEAEDSEESEE